MTHDTIKADLDLMITNVKSKLDSTAADVTSSKAAMSQLLYAVTLTVTGAAALFTLLLID